MPSQLPLSTQLATYRSCFACTRAFRKFLPALMLTVLALLMMVSRFGLLLAPWLHILRKPTQSTCLGDPLHTKIDSPNTPTEALRLTGPCWIGPESTLQFLRDPSLESWDLQDFWFSKSFPAQMIETCTWPNAELNVGDLRYRGAGGGESSSLAM